MSNFILVFPDDRLCLATILRHASEMKISITHNSHSDDRKHRLWSNNNKLPEGRMRQAEA